MKYRLTAAFILITFLVSVGQQKKDIQAYFDKDWNEVKNNDKAVYYRSIDAKGDQYIVRDFFKQTDSLQMEAICSSIEPKLIFDGEIKWYFPNGQLKTQGYYTKGVQYGIEKRYFENGNPHTEIVFKEKKSLYMQYWSVEGKPLLIQGTGVIIDTQPLNKDASHLEIEDSVLIGSYSVSPDLRDTLYRITEQSPEYKGGLKAFYTGLGQVIRYPTEAKRKNIQGKVFIEFNVEKDGEVSNSRVIKGIGGGCDEEALRSLRSQKEWLPAKHKGKPVKAVMIIPINFRLQ